MTSGGGILGQNVLEAELIKEVLQEEGRNRSQLGQGTEHSQEGISGFGFSLIPEETCEHEQNTVCPSLR
jgi:hypothetical protein